MSLTSTFATQHNARFCQPLGALLSGSVRTHQRPASVLHQMGIGEGAKGQPTEPDAWRVQDRGVQRGVGQAVSRRRGASQGLPPPQVLVHHRFRRGQHGGRGCRWGTGQPPLGANRSRGYIATRIRTARKEYSSEPGSKKGGPQNNAWARSTGQAWARRRASRRQTARSVQHQQRRYGVAGQRCLPLAPTL